MDDSSCKKMTSRIKRGESLVKAVMLANGIHKPSRRAVLLTTLASETFITALTQDAVVFKSSNERLRAHHLIHILTGSSRYKFVKNALHKFQIELNNNAHQSVFKDQTTKKGIFALIPKQLTFPQQHSCEDNFNSDFTSETNQNEEVEAKNQDDKHAKKEDSFNAKPDMNFK